MLALTMGNHFRRLVAGEGLRPGKVLLLVAALVTGALALERSGLTDRGASADNVPLYFNYQGYLTDADGEPITATVPMTVTIYSDSSGGSSLLSRTFPAVPVERGVFNIKISLNPADTLVFLTGQRRWIGLNVNGRMLEPRTEMATMPFALHAQYGDRAYRAELAGYADNSDKLDDRHATGFVWNGTTPQPATNFWIEGSGRANQQLVAYANGLASQPAIVGDVQGTCIGVYGGSKNGIGVYATSDAATASYAQGKTSNAFAFWGHNSHAAGTAVAGAGCSDTTFYLEGGSGGAFTARHIGLFAYAHDTTGTGIATMGNRISDTVYTLLQGSGGAFNGTTVGVYGVARNLTGDRCGGFFRTFAGPGSDTAWAYVAYNYGGQKFKVLGNGNVSTVMPTQDGSRILFAPESPEPLFEDYGTARLQNGHCRVNLDPVFLDCIEQQQDRTLRVFITLNDDCKGIYVKSDATGFDAYEVGGGKSNAAFSYRVVGTRRGEAGVRFPVAPAALPSVATPVRSGVLPPVPVR